MQQNMDRLISIVDRESKRIDSTQASIPRPPSVSDEGMVAALHMSYQGPGELRSEGPRHDNDAISITDIRIAPTHEELVCPIPPFLPCNLYNAPHPCGPSSIDRILDIQFRLLREELTAPLRTAVQLVRDDLLNPSPKTVLSGLLKNRGGKYRGATDGYQESVIFNLYTNITFSPITSSRRGLSVGLSLDTPAGRARSGAAKARAAFWASMGGKRLMQGGLVALIWSQGRRIDVYLGIISSSVKELAESSKSTQDQISLRVTFFDPLVDTRILQALRSRSLTGTKLLVEAPVMFESIRPFLEALQVEPESVPFAKYLVHRPHGTLQSVSIDPPKYSTLPAFSFQLASVFPKSAGINDLKMTVGDAASVDLARQELIRGSTLDPSQSTAVIDALTREVALIQG